jgi:hypothetical protein
MGVGRGPELGDSSVIGVATNWSLHFLTQAPGPRPQAQLSVPGPKPQAH